MGKVIAIANQKGGVGKSTVSLLVANTLANAPFNKKICIIDADYQRSIYKLRLFDNNSNPGERAYQVYSFEKDEVIENISTLKKSHDYVFIDVPGKLDLVEGSEVVAYLSLSDYVFIPITPGNFTLQSSIQYIGTVNQVKKALSKKGSDLKVIGFINKFRNTVNAIGIYNDLTSAADQLGIEVMSTYIKEYMVYEDVDTVHNVYNTSAKTMQAVNYRQWFTEFSKIIGL